MRYQILASTISDKLADAYEDFENKFGFGPCGAYATLKREQGWGQVAVCTAKAGKTEFTHYIIVDDGAIIDLANPLDEELAYGNIEILDSDEMPELNHDREAIEWLVTRGI